MEEWCLSGNLWYKTGRLSDQNDSALLHLPWLTIQDKAAVPDEDARSRRRTMEIAIPSCPWLIALKDEHTPAVIYGKFVLVDIPE